MEKNIAIDAGHRTIDGFSGNMIKLDGITSILYDNAKHGRIDKTQGYMRGRMGLSNGVEINEGENDTIRFKIDGGDYKEIKLEPKEYQNISEIANEINNKLNESKIEAYAEIYGNNIKLCSKKLGEGSKVHVDSNSNSYTTFFKREYMKEIVWDPNIVNGKTTTATIEGRYGIGNITKIDEGKNDEITITVDGTEKTIRLDSGEYTVEDLIKNINDQIGELPIEATNENGYIKLVCKNAGSEYRLDNFSDNFYEEVFRKKEIENRIEEPIIKNGGNSYNHDPEAYVVGRKDISQGVVINPNINDELTFNYNHNGKIESISLKLTPGNYSSGELVSEINSKLDEQNIDYVRAQYGGVNTGTTADDSNKLVFKNTREDNGTYVIDGVSGSSAYSIFYNASNEPTPTHTVGVVDLTEGITIEENENDTFIFDENGEKKELKFAASNYSPEEFLNEVNNKLKNANSKFIASYYDGKLKISYDSVGYNTIDNIRGNASKDIFFNSEKREMEDVQRTFQIGANSGENITIAPIRMSTGLLGISTLTLENRKSSEKALRRLDSAILTISQNRSKVGAYENRMEHTIRNIENYSENLQASESRITDLDMAKETMEFVKQNVLSEVSTAILAQSNINVKKIAELILGQ